MDQVNLVISVGMFIGWGFIGVLAYEHYVSGVQNRFRVRDIFYISILTMIDISVAISIFLGEGDVQALSQLRWGVFVATEFAFYHFLITHTLFSRRVQLFITLFFLVSMAMSIYDSTVYAELFVCLTFVVAAVHNGNELVRRKFTPVFISYGILSVTYTGENLSNTLLSLLFTFLFWEGIRAIYKEENVSVLLKKQKK